ncbi:MAG: ABC transporter substrate-binding protein [Mariprofundaceae bacterium]|nr:ABC transporter substrate-binding protein [Mariprofundaceae bacterium]
MIRGTAYLLGLLCCFANIAWAEHQEVTLLLKWKHQFQFAGYYMAVEKGFYYNVGLKVHIIENDSTHDISQTVSKHDGIYGITSSGVLLNYAQGQPIQAIAAILQHSPLALMVLKDSNIHRIGDLKGKRISLEAGIEQIEILVDLAKHHIHSNDYIHHHSKLGIKALIEHRTDAFPVYISHEPKILRQQGVSFRLFYPKDDGIDFYGNVLITSKQETSEHSDRVNNFLKATQRGWIYALNHVDESIDVILKQYNSQHLSRQHLTLEAQTLKRFIMADVVPIGYMNPIRWQHIAQTYISLGFMPDNIDLTSFIYHSPQGIDHWFMENRWQIITSTLLLFLFITFLIVWILRKKDLQRISQLEDIQRNNIEKENMQLELKEKNQQLQKALKYAEQATQSKGQFLATMSHEIRTPLNGVLGLTELVLDSNLTSQQRGYLHTIQASGEALLSILNDILDFSKIEAGLMEIKTREFNPNHLIEHVAKLFSSRVNDQKPVMLITQGIPLLPHLIMGDVDHLHQVLVNLLSNAVKFTEHGEIILSVTQQSESAQHVLLRFQVKDTGMGISTHDQTHLFHAFTQVDSTYQRKHGGTGLGLSIVKRLVILMGSHIQLNSKLGNGSTFFFDLNLKKSEQINIGDASDYTAYFCQWHVLLIDHHGGHRNMLQKLLQAWGIHCIAYSSMHDAQRALSQMNYDIVFASKEDIDSNEALSQSILNASAKLIMIIQNDVQMDVELREKYGLNGFMRKPIFIHSLCETLLSVMDVKERPSTIIHHTNAKKRNEYILLAEDNLVNQQVVLGMLERQGFEYIDVVGDGLAAVESSKERHYDLILLDVQMPHKDGLSACREIRDIETMQGLQRTPIVALTAHALEEDRQASLQAGMDDHLTKPLTGKSLKKALDRWLPSTHIEHETIQNQPIEKNNKHDPLAILDQHDLCQLRQDIGFGIGMILDTYMQSLPDHVARIKQAIADNDGDALRRCGHKLKGSSRSIAAMQLGELGCHIEKFGKNGDVDKACHQMAALELAVQDVTAALSEAWVEALR